MMKTILTIAALSIFTAAYAGDDGTTSVLATNEAQTVSAPAVTVVPAAAPCCEPTAKVVKLAPWTVRRLNRIADRQEAREERKCCCNPCACNKDCCDDAKVVLVESRRNCCR